METSKIFFMEDGAFTPSTMLGPFPDNTTDFDLMDELLYDRCWVETTDGSSFGEPGLSISGGSNFSSHYLPFPEINMDHLNPNPYQGSFEEETGRSNSSDNPPLIYHDMEELAGIQRHNWEAIPTASSLSQSEIFPVEGTEMSRRLWIGPSANQRPNIPMKKRLMLAIEYLKDSIINRDVLIQMWIPIKREGRRVLTTNNQPFSLDKKCRSLADYRNISRNFQFAVENDSKEQLGLPGRVFLKKLPEWTPDVRFFSREECPRISYAQLHNVSGSLALPIFERGSGTCLGVVEIVTTTQKVNYRPELENVCKALEAVDLRSCEKLSTPKLKACDESYQAALAEIQEVLKSVCDTHKLPLAQTWAPSTQQGTGGCRYYDENTTSCVSIVDSAFYVPNEQVLGFHEACSEHDLLRGEGVAGGAFMTHQPCFAADITAFSKTEYPLSHYARMFGLHAALAIRVRSIYTGSADFILEFFLPLDCKDAEQQKQMLGSITSVIQQVCRSLRVVTDEELMEETAFPVREVITPLVGRPDKEDTPKLVSFPSKEATQDESSWIAHMTEAQRIGKGVSLSLGYHKEEPEEEFKVTTHWYNNETELHQEPVFSEHKQIQQDSISKGSSECGGKFSSVGGCCPSGARKAGEKKRTKTERTITLQVLQQYFCGSLKDAAKSIGVCPTTLKRICRQQGITRWPSRKIKKVGHSLRKLQLVIDSVQGAKGSIQLSSFYTNFPELNSPKLPITSPFSTSNMNDHLMRFNSQAEGCLLSLGTTASKLPPSTCCRSSSSIFCCSPRAKRLPVTVNASGSADTLTAEQLVGLLNRECTDAVVQNLGEEETKFLIRSHSHKIFSEQPSLEALSPLPNSNRQVLRDGGAFRVKASFGEEKIRFSMPRSWGYRDLEGEIVRRFNMDDISMIDLKYLDDDSEWVLLTCNADLEECIDIHRSSRSRTIKLSLHQAFH